MKLILRTKHNEKVSNSRFHILVWNAFRAVAESEMDLWDLAEQLAYDNFQSYSCENDIAEEEGYDPDEMEESDWDGVQWRNLWKRPSFTIERI